MSVNRKKSVFIIHIVIAILEIIAACYMLGTEGLSVFRYYTVDSNILQLIVSVWYIICFIRKKEVPKVLVVLHLISAVCLTVTFMIAAFVLTPQSTFSYYFLENVAPINHFLGPVLSVAALMVTNVPIPKKAFVAPAAATILYGVVALILNAVKVLDGPYFFLEIYKTPVQTIVMWFAIIFVLCIGLAYAYMRLHRLCEKTNSNKE